jgi:hypothetical protein
MRKPIPLRPDYDATRLRRIARGSEVRTRFGGSWRWRSSMREAAARGGRGRRGHSAGGARLLGAPVQRAWP